MTAARLDIRLDKEIKAKAEKASALLGLKSLTEYVVRLMDEDEDATRIIAEYESMTLENDAFDQFMATCEQVEAPNKALLKAAAFSKENGFK